MSPLKPAAHSSQSSPAQPAAQSAAAGAAAAGFAAPAFWSHMSPLKPAAHSSQSAPAQPGAQSSAFLIVYWTSTRVSSAVFLTHMSPLKPGAHSSQSSPAQPGPQSSLAAGAAAFWSHMSPEYPGAHSSQSSPAQPTPHSSATLVHTHAASKTASRAVGMLRAYMNADNCTRAGHLRTARVLQVSSRARREETVPSEEFARRRGPTSTAVTAASFFDRQRVFFAGYNCTIMQ